MISARTGGAAVAALGAMMNTRGLMGLIVLGIGLNMGIISPALFAMMVLMALATPGFAQTKVTPPSNSYSVADDVKLSSLEETDPSR